MAFDGECIMQLFTLITNSPALIGQPNGGVVLDLPASTNRCCSNFKFNVIADAASEDAFKNDSNGFLYAFPPVITGASLFLQKDGEDIETLDDDDFGINYAFGFFTNSNGDKYRGYQLSWKKVMDEYGPGCYRVRIFHEDSFENDYTFYSDTFILKQYSPGIADGTVKIEYYLNYLIGDNADDKAIRDFGGEGMELENWYNALRLPGWFGYPVSEYEEDVTRYTNGLEVAYKNNQKPELTLQLKLVPAAIHNLMRTDVLQADTVLITDYNSVNAEAWIQKQVRRSSGYAPKWTPGSKLAPVEVKFIQAYNNLFRRRC